MPPPTPQRRSTKPGSVLLAASIELAARGSCLTQKSGNGTHFKLPSNNLQPWAFLSPCQSRWKHKIRPFPSNQPASLNVASSFWIGGAARKMCGWAAEFRCTAFSMLHTHSLAPGIFPVIPSLATYFLSSPCWVLVQGFDWHHHHGGDI